MPQEPQPEPEQAVDQEEPHEHLVAAAEELELADRIFSHRDGDSVQAEEEKLELVEQEQTEPFGGETANPAIAPIYRGEDEFSGASVVADIEADDLEVLEAEEAEETLPAVEDLAPEIEEALEERCRRRGRFQRFGERSAGSGGESKIVRRPCRRLSCATPTIVPCIVFRAACGGGRGGNRFGQGQPGGGGIRSLGTGSAAAPALESQARTEPARESVEEHATERPERVMPSISELLKPGQEIIVQIAKEPLGQKGARITSHVALPGRYVVFMPSVEHLGVSRKVASDEERHRLKRILQTHRVGTTGGFIVRTAGEGVPEEEIAADMNFLYSLWLDIRQKAEKKPAPALLHYDLDMVQRILRDQRHR